MGDTTNDNGHDNQTWCVPLSLLGLSTHSPKNKNEEELQLKQQDNDNNQPQEQQCRRRRRRRKNVTTITKLVQLLTLVTFVVVIILFKRCTTNTSSSSSTTLSSSSIHTVLEDDNPYNISFLVREDDNSNPYYIDLQNNETYDEFIQRTLDRSADNIEGRMLAACVTAYGINPSSADDNDGRVFEPSEKYYRASGWLSSPTVIQHGPAHIHAALVGLTVDGVVIAFRGTLGSGRGWQSYVDYIQSDVLMYPYSIGRSSSSNQIMKVYAGAYFSFEQLWSWNPFYTYWRCLLLPWNGCMIRNNVNENLLNYHMIRDKNRKKTTIRSPSPHSHKNVYLRNEIARQLNIATALEAEAAATAEAEAASLDSSSTTQQRRPRRPMKLYVTGHSKGGTMAIYAAMKINQQPTYQRFFHTTEEANHTAASHYHHSIVNGTAYNYTRTFPNNTSKHSSSIPKNPLIVEHNHNQEYSDDDDDETNEVMNSHTIPTAVYTFAAMKAGNRAFVEELSNIPIHQYENFYDIIPLLFPPSSIQMQSIQAQLNQELPADDRPLVDAALNGTSTSNMKSLTNTHDNKNDNLLNLLQMMSYISTHHPHHVAPNQNIYSSIYHNNYNDSTNHRRFGSSTTFTSTSTTSMFRRGGLRSWNHNTDNDEDDDEFYHAALPQNRFCMTYHKHSKTVDMQPCTYELDELRLHDIIQNLMVPTVLEEEEKNSKSSSTNPKETNADATTSSLLFSASSHHKPSCKGMGYMHGVCETVCT